MSEKLQELYQKSSFLIRDQKWEELVSVLTEIISLELNQKKRARAYYNRGNAKDKLGEYKVAIADYDKAIELNPDYAGAYNNRGNAKGKLGEYKAAIADYDKAIELNPDDARAYNNRGNAKGKLGEYKAAIADYDKVIELNPDDAGAYNNRGNAKGGLGEYKAAIVDYDKAIELNPDYAGAYNNRGNAKGRLGEYAAAVADYDKAIELNPDHAGAYNNRGATKSELGEYAAAIADYNKAIEFKPGFAEPYNNRGNAKYSLGDYSSAVADYDKAIEFKPGFAEPYNNRGLAKDKLGDYSVAVADYDKAIELNPGFTEAYYNRGNAKGKLGEYKVAIADYDKAIELNPNYAGAYNNRGNAKGNLGEHTAAIADYDKVIELNPNSAGAYYNRGNVKYKSGDYGRAVEDFVRADEHDQTLKFRFPVIYIACRINSIFSNNLENRNVTFELYTELLKAIENIQKKLFYNQETEVVHYTSLHTLKNLAQKGRFRLYNASYMNDPEEGRIFFDIMKTKYEIDDEIDIEKMFYEENEHSSPRSPAYIGSFIELNSNEQETSKDKLFLWRTYGNHDAQEAAGSCLVFRRESFAKEFQLRIGKMEEELLNSPSDQSAERYPQTKHWKNRKLPLFRVSYGNIRDQEELEELAKCLKDIKDHLGKEELSEAKPEFKELVRELLDSIRFLFKESHYSEEKEVRVIDIRYYKEDTTQGSDGVKIDVEQIPPRFYLETPESFRFDEVLLGPRARNIQEWEQWIKEQDADVKVEKSKIKYGNTH